MRIRRISVEQCTSINISNLQKAIRKLIDKDYPECSHEDLFKYTKLELDKFEVNDQKFEYQFIANVLGGHRWFFVCPKCKRQTSKLFLPPEGYPGYERLYLCKTCHKILNESVMKASNKMYKNIIRPLRKLRAIETKLEKGHLTEDKVKELLDEYDVLEKQVKSCPEYRIYTFKKKRGMGLL